MGSNLGRIVVYDATARDGEVRVLGPGLPSKLPIALEVRRAMAEHRKGKPLAFPDGRRR